MYENFLKRVFGCHSETFSLHMRCVLFVWLVVWQVGSNERKLYSQAICLVYFKKIIIGQLYVVDKDYML